MTAGIDLNLEPSFKDGELYGRVSRVRYWEDVVRVTGSRNGRPLSGRGYVELTGYGKPLRSGKPLRIF
ncbi:MAG: lipocalin family protein [Akkermansiaceae bacterium]|jgi:predicted secreted hydrolase